MKAFISIILGFSLCFSGINYVYAENENNWKNAYINYLQQDFSPYGYEGYALIDVNGDEIPELYMLGDCTASGERICTYNKGQVIELYGWTYGTSYVKGKNLLNVSGGHMDAYFDHIYKIENGEFVQLHMGDYGAEDNSQVKYDKEDNPIYIYTWDDRIVTQSQYNELLNDYYNKYLPVYAHDEVCDINEIINKIKNYKSKDESQNIKVILNGKEIIFNENPYIENGTTRVPMRAIFEALGTTVDYNATTKTITASKDATVIELVTGASTAKINGKEMTLTASVENKNGYTMVPLRFVSEALGAEVLWDGNIKVITINL